MLESEDEIDAVQMVRKRQTILQHSLKNTNHVAPLIKFFNVVCFIRQSLLDTLLYDCNDIFHDKFRLFVKQEMSLKSSQTKLHIENTLDNNMNLE